ncbi:glycosyltransferase family 4 protein [Patescibacteria group bacterium]|nr:glycosyltransferase family 4 protein [Patescibacteria group bacterium]
MRILFLTNHLNGHDGWSRYSLDIIKQIKKQGHEILCLTSVSSDRDIVENTILSSPLKYLANPIEIFFTAQKVNKEIVSFSPDVVHFMAEPYINLLPFLNIKKIPVYLTIHGSYSYLPNLLKNSFKQFLSRWWYRKVLKLVRGIIPVSNHTKNYFLNSFSDCGTRKKIEPKVKVITNGVDLSSLKINNQERSESKIKNILFVGAVKSRKGLLEAIEALKLYYNNYSKDFIFNIVGSYNATGSYYLDLSKKIKEYNLDDKIIFYGRVNEENLEDFYEQADLFLMLSVNVSNKFEGFGLVYLEANVRGVPCIGADNSGAREAVVDGQTGFVVEVDKFEEVAERINDVLNNSAIKREECVGWAKKNDVKLKVEELLRFYKSS